MIQLDTHALLWLESEHGKLSAPARSSIETARLTGETIAVAAVTLWEIALLAKRGRVLAGESIESFLNDIERNYKIIPVSAAIAFLAAELPHPFPKDPMDRLITATALTLDLTLITADRSILASRACKLLW